ncbi:hypothetical protein DFJ67_8308 [Asanoa ferruginea]|uniref:Uncharacterized protein n=1 Tax=Asanoa ferruginea TaxID=53367 RepID=A0A3D9ZYP3_9ACTN|nr:hypothetical protein DFJ67_8308 [Asanoa ferruginea]
MLRARRSERAAKHGAAREAAGASRRAQAGGSCLGIARRSRAKREPAVRACGSPDAAARRRRRARREPSPCVRVARRSRARREPAGASPRFVCAARPTQPRGAVALEASGSSCRPLGRRPREAAQRQCEREVVAGGGESRQTPHISSHPAGSVKQNHTPTRTVGRISSSGAAHKPGSADGDKVERPTGRTTLSPSADPGALSEARRGDPPPRAGIFFERPGPGQRPGGVRGEAPHQTADQASEAIPGGSSGPDRSGPGQRKRPAR